ncbi:GAF domain-containing protein [Methanobacterium oryzae]|uniref:GAF domain-containing protein n=1 Tax=Methanobacterium oryzae TaxID=69540 RepID=UPI003D20FF77
MIRRTEINDNINFSKKELIKTKNQILDMISTSPFKEISDFILQEAMELTGSKYCYVAYVDPQNKDSVGISFTKMTPECDAYEKIGEARFPVRKDGTYGGLLGYSLDTGESFYVHDISSHPAAHGIPNGHEPVDQFLSVPVKYEDQIIGQIALANPKEDYSDYCLEIVNKLAEIYSIVLKKFLLK